MKALRLPDEAWQTRGKCVTGGHDPDIWTGDDTNEDRIRLAKRICRECPVIDECLEQALAVGDYTEAHVMGGLTGTERGKLRRSRNRPTRAPQPTAAEPPQPTPAPRKRMRTAAQVAELIEQITVRVQAGDSNSTISRDLGIPDGTVSYYRHRARKQAS